MQSDGDQDPIYSGNIQELRFFAALWVAAFHLNLLYGLGLDIPWVVGIVESGYAGVDVFFVISGFIMARTTQHMPATARDAARFLGRRFLRIYSGWWPFFLAYLAYGAATQGIGAEKRLLSSFLLLPTLLPHHLVPIAWTLSFELFFYICTAAIVLWNRQRADGAMVGWCASVILLNALWLATGRYHPDNLGDVSISQWFFFYPLALEFIAGFLLHGWLCRHDGARWQPWAAGAGLFCVVISVYERFGVLHESGLAGFFHACERALLWGGFAVCLVAAAIRMERAGVSPAPWAKALGDASYSIYLGHMLLILVFVSWLSRGPTVPGAHALLFALVLAGMMLVLWLYYIWIERPLYRLATRVLLADPSRDGSLIHRQT